VGHRANLILVEGREYQLYYGHWCANTLPRDLFWGPEHAAAFMRIQRAVDDSGWLDDIWAEGGAVLDLGRRHLLLYGGEDVLYNVPLRRFYLELLVRVWKGWTVRWAHEGIADLADYVGYPRDRVLTNKDKDSTGGTLLSPKQMDWTDLVASVRFDEHTVRFYPLAGNVKSHLSSGKKLVDNLRPADGLPRLLLGEWTTEFPSGGFHLDLPARRLEFWVADDAPDIQNRISSLWSGWETRWHHDQYERQLDMAQGLLQLPIIDRQALLDRCRAMLLWDRSTSPVDTIRMLADHDRAQGKDVEVNPWALRDDRHELSKEDRIAILDQVMSLL
jgi:hypothetical protein